jgi:predicted ATP pyrophosphatase (TIGR00289 family)
LHKAIKKGYEIKYLLAIIPDNFDSFMFHKPYLNLLDKQAEMLGLKDKLILVKSKGEKEKELEDLELLLSKVKDKVKGIVVGGIASNYQGDRIKKICDKFNLKFIAPLLNYQSEDVWKELFKEKFKVILTKIACEGLNKDWIGGIIDKKKFEKLKKLSEKYKFRIDFEGGEAESAVLFMPEFKKEIKIKFNIQSEGKYRHWIDELKILR